MTTSVKNRGKDLEQLVIQSNHVYRMRQEAVIHQAHAEVKTIRGRKGTIVNAFHKGKAGLDFYGIADGRYITFDTKQTASKTSIPLGNIEHHQYNTVIETDRAGGIAFLLVRFSYWGETYYLSAEQLRYWWTQQERKSIPYAWFQANCRVVKSQSAAALDWLSVVREELGDD